MPIAGPTYRVEMALSSDLTGYFAIGTGKIGTDKLGGEFFTTGFADLQARLMGFETSRGREDELSGISAGSIRADLTDHDGALDPENTASPYYPNVKLLRRLRVVANYGGADYGLGYGFVTDYGAEPRALGANVAVQATDLFTRMGRKRPPVAYPRQGIRDRIHAMLDQLQWPTGRMRNIQYGQLVVPAATVGTDPTMLEHVDTMLKAERGVFFIGGSGAVTYHSRQHRIGRSSRGTFGAGGLLVKDVRPVYNDGGIYNDVRGKRTDGTEQVAADTASGRVYDWRTYTIPTDGADLLSGDAELLSLATWLLNQRKEPVQRVASITLDPEGDPDALWPHVLGAEIGDRITLNHDVPGTKGITALDCFVERIEHRWSVQDGHTCTWGLSRVPANNDQYLTLGHPTRGRVGTGRLAF